MTNIRDTFDVTFISGLLAGFLFMSMFIPSLGLFRALFPLAGLFVSWGYMYTAKDWTHQLEEKLTTTKKE